MPRSDNFHFITYDNPDRVRFYEAAAALTGFKIRIYKHLSRTPPHLQGPYPRTNSGERRISLSFSNNQSDWGPFWNVVHHLEQDAQEHPEIYGDEAGSFLDISPPRSSPDEYRMSSTTHTRRI